MQLHTCQHRQLRQPGRKRCRCTHGAAHEHTQSLQVKVQVRRIVANIYLKDLDMEKKKHNDMRHAQSLTASGNEQAVQYRRLLVCPRHCLPSCHLLHRSRPWCRLWPQVHWMGPHHRVQGGQGSEVLHSDHCAAQRLYMNMRGNDHAASTYKGILMLAERTCRVCSDIPVIHAAEHSCTPGAGASTPRPPIAMSRVPGVGLGAGLGDGGGDGSGEGAGAGLGGGAGAGAVGGLGGGAGDGAGAGAGDGSGAGDGAGDGTGGGDGFEVGVGAGAESGAGPPGTNVWVPVAVFVGHAPLPLSPYVSRQACFEASRVQLVGSAGPSSFVPPRLEMHEHVTVQLSPLCRSARPSIWSGYRSRWGA